MTLRTRDRIAPVHAPILHVVVWTFVNRGFNPGPSFILHIYIYLFCFCIPRDVFQAEQLIGALVSECKSRDLGSELTQVSRSHLRCTQLANNSLLAWLVNMVQDTKTTC